MQMKMNNDDTITIENISYNGVPCDMECFNELYHGEEDNDYIDLFAFISSLEPKQREYVLNYIKMARMMTEE